MTGRLCEGFATVIDGDARLGIMSLYEGALSGDCPNLTLKLSV
jgi:hypothetical protein